MKKFFLILLLLVVLAVAGVLALIMRSFNPAAYQAQVVEAIQQLTGREMKVLGETAVSWNPVPTIIMEDVRLSNIEKSAHPDMLSIDKIKIEIAWESLLKSPLVIKSVELTHPTLILERLESNRANFAFPFLMDTALQVGDMALFDNGNATKIDKIYVKGGTVEYNNAITKKALTVTDIDGQIKMDSVKGPFGLKGIGNVNNHQYGFDITAGVFQLDSPVDIVVGLTEDAVGLNLKLEGVLTPAKTDKWFDGSGDFVVQKPITACQILQIPAPYEGMTDQPVSGSVVVEITPTTEAVKKFSIEVPDGQDITKVGGTIGQTVIGQNITYQVDLTMDTFRPDRWANYVQKLDWSWLKGEENFRPVQFSITFKDMPYKSGKICDVHVEGKYENKVLTIQKGTAVLPGETMISFTGTGNTPKEKPMMDISGEMTSKNILAVIEAFMPKEAGRLMWLKDKPASGKVRVAWTPEQVGISVKDLTANQAVVNGLIRKNKVKTPVYEAKLTVKNANLDEYLGWKKPEKPMDLAELVPTIKHFLENTQAFVGLSVSAKLTGDDITLLGLPMRELTFTGEINDGVCKITDLKAREVAAANIAVSGAMSGLGTGNLSVEGLTVNVEAKQVPLLLQKAGITAAWPFIQKATLGNLMAVIKGGKDGAWSGKLQASLSDAVLKLEGDVAAVESNPTAQKIAFELTHPNFKTFMSLIAPETQFLPNLDGTFKTKGTVSGTMSSFQVQDLTFGVGLQQLSGNISFDNQKIKTVVADLASPSVDLERFSNNSGAWYAPMSGFSKQKIDLSALNDWNVDLKLKTANLAYKDMIVKQADVAATVQNKELSVVKLEGVSGSSDQSPIKINGKLDWNTVPTVNAVFEVKNTSLRPDFLVLPEIAFGGGTISVSGDIKARGETPEEMAKNLNGQGKLAMAGGQIIGADLEQMIPVITRAIQRNESPKTFEPEFKRVLHSGKTAVKSWTGDFTISNGVMRLMDMTMRTNNSVANPTQIVWNIPKRTMDISIPVMLNPLNTLPPFVLGISVVGNKGTYKPNYSDISAALSNQSQTALVEGMRQKEEKAQMEVAQKRSDRVAQSKKLTLEAREAVNDMNKKLKEFPFEKGRRILQGARDALAIVNQTAVREEPTDAQLIQQIEQARLVLIKADEFNKALEQESAFGAQKTLKDYQEKGSEMVRAMRQAATNYPDVAVLVKLADNAEQNMAIITQMAGQITPATTPTDTEKVMKVCADAYGKIEKAYQHIQRFDLSGGTTAPTTTVRGSLKRAH